eukprot:8467287-Prorocentrum_lima.AAC.1
MTSSLVGSEMCIRDRHKGVRISRPPSPRHSPRRQTHGRRDVEDGRIAVSYTHLTLPTICSV